MNVTITTFRSPFSFFCLVDGAASVNNFTVIEETGCQPANKTDVSRLNHAEYVAVLWNHKWARGIVSLENQFLIWLVDHGIYIRPDDNTVYVSLPPEYKKLPTKVFEASVHGILPMEMELTEMCQLENRPSMCWSDAAINKGKELVSSADEVIFVPISLLSTKHNDVVLGNLYIKKDEEIKIFIEELEQWPVHLVKSPKMYIENISALYNMYRRQHRACLLKPELLGTSLPTITPVTSLQEYTAICDASPELESDSETRKELDSDDSSLDGTTITYVDIDKPKTKLEPFKLTAAQIERYSNAFVTVAGREYNLLNLIVNKARDMAMCDKYGNTKRTVGRATSRSSRF